MPKYYFSTLVRRPLTFSGRQFTFFVTSVRGGSASGIYEATSEEEIAVLDDAVRGRRGVQEIGAEEFEELKKKATRTPQRANSNGSPPRIARPQIQPPVAMEEKAGVPSAESAKAKPTGKDVFSGPGGTPHAAPSIKSLLKTSRVTPPRPFSQADAKIQKAAKRASNKAARVARAPE